MDRLQEYLENNFKLAYKSVTFHFKRFVWFYIALFVVQTLLGVICFSARINSVNMSETVSEKYNSHYVFYYMNADQRRYLERASIYYFKDDHFFDIKDIKEYGEIKDYDYKCDVYIAFAKDPQKGIEQFERKYLEGLEKHGNVFCAPTPLFELDNNIQKNNLLYNIYLIIISVFSFILLTILYNIRANNYRFDYGIYMSFGADQKKIFNTSFWEMTVIAILTFIPSIVISALIDYFVSSVTEVQFVFKITDCLKVFVLTLVINALSVLFVTTKTALKTPISLISSKDNSNFVFSPKTSVNLFVKKPLRKVIGLSLIRYAKYYSVLIISGVLFSALFVCGVFCANLNTEKIFAEQPQFEVTFTGNKKYNEKDKNYFLEFEGITGTFKETYIPAMGLYEHILVPKSNTKLTANLLPYDKDYYALDNVDYCAADTEVIEYLKKQKYSGDLDSILTQENTIIISDSFNNSTYFKFKPGDKIKLADYYTKTEEPDYLLQGKDLLKERLRCYIFKYTEYTVGAVIHDNGSKNLKLYMNNQMYEKITDRYADYKKVYLYADSSLTTTQTDKLYSDILRIDQLQFRNSDNSVYVNVKNLYTDCYKDISEKTGFSIKLSLISLILLFVSAIICFFSQTLFYAKRYNEFTLLRAVGLTQKNINQIIFSDAVLLSFMSLIPYFVLSYLFPFLVYKFMNSFFFMYEFRFSFAFPETALIIGGICTFVFVFISTYLTYYVYKAKNKNAIPEV